MATANLLHQAIAMGIYCHVMGGFDKAKSVDALGLTDDQEPVCAIALGHLGDAEELEEPYKSRELGERTRKPIAEFTKML
jgi:nitroreductase